MWNIELTISRRAEEDVINTGEFFPASFSMVRDGHQNMIEAIEIWLAHWLDFAYFDNHGHHMPARMAALKRKP